MRSKSPSAGRKTGEVVPLLLPQPSKDKKVPSGFISLLSDFGLTDAYVGIMKGVIAGINPPARVIDLSHGVAPQDVRGAAFLLVGAFSYFPAGTVHVAVVDPTVGSERRALCVQAGEYYFVGPDNGILSMACYRAGRPKIFLLENDRFFLKDRSHTFHGRDIFAPVAAHLSAGVPVESMGRRVRSMKRIQIPRPTTGQRRDRPDSSEIRGRIVYVDRFGNLVTNVRPDMIRNVFGGKRKSRFVIDCAGKDIRGLRETYSDVPSGTALMLIGSHGFLEIAVCDGNAAETFGLGQGGRIRLYLA